MRKNAFTSFCSKLIGVSLFLTGCSVAHEPCRSIDNKHPICGTSRPEDIARIPGQPLLIISEMGDPLNHLTPGGLSLLNTNTNTFTPLDPYTINTTRDNSDHRWGDPLCSTSPPVILSPHGIHLSARSDDRMQLLVINHGSREAVEYFEVSQIGDTITVTWKGCVNPTPATFLNNIVSLSNGGFIASQAYDYDAFSIGALNIELIKGVLGWDTGYLFEWNTAQGFTKIPGSNGPFVNGVAISDDEESVYATYYMGDEVRKIHRSSGERLATMTIPQPDNLTWTTDGQLLVASHQGYLVEKLLCLLTAESACTFQFGIYTLDADSLNSTEIINHKGYPMGGVTVATQLDSSLYLGSYSGDRVMRIPFPKHHVNKLENTYE
ncbi:hypothetical protein A9Q99_19395 [Gammaproteobacteria bacterium 45_16_T64]|nr:hypothetical protein A9Q99_19395 [Gammaproteobacteria bacterium 45_16_T64]